MIFPRKRGHAEVLSTGSTTDMRTTQSKYGRRFDEEFKREVAALASKPGANQEQVARDPGVSPYSVSRWKKLYADGPAGPPLASARRSWSARTGRCAVRTKSCANNARS